MTDRQNEVLLQAKKLCYSYDRKNAALEEVDLTVRMGERIAVLGSNGAGKSTFFLNLNGVLTPDSGTILYRGTEITKYNRKELRKHVGIVFQESEHQIIASTVADEVSFGPMNLKLAKAEVQRRVDEALERMNLTEMRERPPHHLSGGEKKRVCIADIIAMEPEIFLFDEPTASLDPLNERVFETTVETLWEMGKTILISTHDVDFAYRFADRAVVFAGGRVIADGPPEAIFQNEELLQQANLKKPVFLEVCELLAAHGLVEQGSHARDAAALEGLLRRRA